MPSGNKFIDIFKEAPISILIIAVMIGGFIYSMMTHFGHTKEEVEAMRSIRHDCWARESERATGVPWPYSDVDEGTGMRIAAECERRVRRYLGMRE